MAETDGSAADQQIDPHSKPCTVCDTPRDVLVRCQIDESGTWHFVCPGSCWKRVSGGVIDGDSQHSHYRYGGMWKNKHAGVSAKKPKNKKNNSKPSTETMPPAWSAIKSYTKNDRVSHNDQIWICRKSHAATEDEDDAPSEENLAWKEAD